MIPKHAFPRMLATLLAGIGMTLMIGCSQPTPASGPAGVDEGGAIEEGGSGSSGGSAAQPTYTDGVDPSRSSKGDEVYPPPATAIPVPAGYPEPDEPSEVDEAGGDTDAVDDSAADGDDAAGEDGSEEEASEDEG